MRRVCVFLDVWSVRDVVAGAARLVAQWWCRGRVVVVSVTKRSRVGNTSAKVHNRVRATSPRQGTCN
jgi:acyl-CoA hydrolase